MPWALSAIAALAGAEVPDLDDPAGWEAAAPALQAGPPGCYEVVGRASWRHDLGRWGATRGDAVFAGRLEDGVWGGLRVWPTGEVTERRGEEGTETFAEAVRFAPMIGRVRGLQVMLDDDRELVVRRSRDARIDPVNTVEDVLGRLSDDVETSWVTWDAEAGAVVLERTTVAGRSEAEVRTRTRFPEGGLVADAVDVELIGTYVHRGFVPARVDALEVHLRAHVDGDRALPAAEAVRFELALPLVRLVAAQTIEYTHVSPCRSVGGDP